jgi:tetratricopeptide (TPR) repeat protein
VSAGDSTLVPGRARRLEAACDAFERAWAAGGSPRAEDYLAGCDESVRPKLLRELVHLDLYYRRRRGEACTLEDYRARFPDLDPGWLTAAIAGAASSGPRTAVHPVPVGGDEPHEAGADRLPRIFGDYELQAVLGRGGMGVVYRARHVRLGRVVALKLIRAGEFAAPAEVRRFRSEAEAVAQLDHPGIVPVYESGERDGLPYFTMKLVEGGSLAQRLADYRLPVDARGGLAARCQLRVARLVAAVARAVHHAHERGVLHRDLKPGNILLDERGEPLVTDFGLAKRADADGSLTETGAPVGTAAYMPPEQARGERLPTIAADVYGIGAVLYELLTGRPPFRGDGFVETLRLVEEEEVAPPRRVQPAANRDLEAVCLKCLEKEPARRYRSAQELADELERYLRHEPVSAAAPSPAARLGKFVRRHKGPVLAAVLVFLTLIGGVVGTTAGMLRAARDRDEALRQRRRTRQALDDMLGDQSFAWLKTQKQVLPEQRRFLETALAYYREFAAEAGSDNDALRLEAEANYRVGRILDVLQQETEAEGSYRRAATLYGQLAEAEPGTVSHRTSLADCYLGLGHLLQGLHRFDEAEAACRMAMAVEEQLVAEHPSVPEYRKQLARAYHNLATSQWRRGHRAAAETGFQKALAVETKLAEEFPGQPGYREDLARSYNNMAVLLEDLHRASEAEAAYRAALRILERLAAENPNEPEYRKLQGGARGNLGALLDDQNKRSAAEAEYRAAIIVFERLAEDYPGVPVYRQTLATNHFNLANSLAAAGRRPEAETACRAAIAIQEKLVADYPAVPDYRNELVSSLINNGVELAKAGRSADAAAASRAALAHAQRLVAEHPGEKRFVVKLGHALLRLGYQADPDKDPRSALEWYGKAIDVLGPLAQGPDETARRFLRSALRGRASALGELGRHTEAVADWQSLLAIAAASDVTGIRAWLADSLVRAGETQRAIAVAGEVYADADASSDALYNAACALALIAGTRSPHAEPCAAQAVEMLRAAFARGPADTAALCTDSDLAALRNRVDFANLLWDVADGVPKP